MRDQLKYFPVNWVDGMKINKNHFVEQENAITNALHDIASLSLSPYRHGVLPPSAGSENTFNVKISMDNQNAIRVAVLACQAITPGGVRISIPAFSSTVPTQTDEGPSIIFPFNSVDGEMDWWIVLVINPYTRQPAGSPDVSEKPPRYPNVLPTYSIQLVSAKQYTQYTYHPYALTIGKIFVNGTEIVLEDYYIPPCVSISAHPDLISLLGEFDEFLAALERYCTVILQKIFKKNQPNNLTELVMFLCDRVIIYLGQALTSIRWMALHESPAALFFTMATLARAIKNTINLRIGSGREELMNYLSEWCDLKQGELESLLNSISNMSYYHNDVNKNISEAAVFVKLTDKLFKTLSKLEFIGERKRSGLFVNEEQRSEVPKNNKKRFLG